MTISMEKTSLTYNTFKNISYNVIGYIWPMIFALFVTPIIIFHLGIKNYGIYLLIYTYIALLSLLDFGLGVAIIKHLTFYCGKKDELSITNLIHTSNSLYFMVGLFGLIVSACITSVGLFGPNFFPTQFAGYIQYSWLFLIAGLIFFVNSISTLYSMVFYSLQRFDLSNKIGMVSLAITSFSTLAVVLLHGSLQMIFLTQLAVNVIFAAIAFRYAKKILPQLSFSFGWDRKEVKKYYSFGLVASINNIANTALSSLDRMIIPFFAGPSNLTYYSVPGNVTGKIPGFANTLSTTLFPMTSQLDGSKDRARIEVLYVRSFRLITIIASALTITAIAFAYKILLYWLNADFAIHSTYILIILAFTNFILAMLGPLSNFILGLGKLKFLTTMSVIMGILNAILLLILLPRYGITGAAWAYLLSILPVGYMFYHTEKKFLFLFGRKEYYLKKFLMTVITSLVVWIIDVYFLSPLVVDLATLLCMGAVSLVFYILLYKLFGFFEREDWRDMEIFFGAMLDRMKLGRFKKINA
jgi:O-antigen/teichoic acid export membrane protein